MADPSKPLNRLKPFRRINNESFLATSPPDGLGVPCGCHTPAEFGDFEQPFKDFLDSKLPVPLLKVLDAAKRIADAAAEVARIAAVALGAALAAIPGLAAGPIGPIIGALVGVVAITKFLNDVVDVITSALRGFLVLIGRRLALRAVRVIPQWVPVLRGASNARVTPDQIKEIEGTVTRSFGDPIEPPFAQWHTWLNWTVHVQPEERYRNLLSPADNPPNLDGAGRDEQALARPRSLEIQWDAGALFEEQSTFASGFKDTDIPRIDGPMTSGEWLWPITGMFFWASGRWVYDCSRTTPGENPQMCTMLTPPRAIATATWEAVQFPENDPGDQKPSKVPAIRFMFFACKRGGYLSYDSLAEEDYEFILDLPPLEQKVSPFPIGHTPGVPHNVVVLRPRLLKGRVSLPFAGAKLLDPVIEEIAPEDPSEPPRQVKITIPKSQLDGVEAAGVILSLGWFDPNLERAATVKVCRVSFSGLSGRLKLRDDPAKQIREMFKKEEAQLRKEISERIANLKILGFSLNDIPKIPDPRNPSKVIDIGGELKRLVEGIVDRAVAGFIDLLAAAVSEGVESEEWLLRIGVNGRWQTRYFPDVDKSAFAFPQPAAFEVFLGPDDLLFYSAGGVELNPVGDMMRAPRSSRTLKIDGRSFTWQQLATATGAEHQKLVFQYALEVLTGNSASANPALGLESTPLGIIDPDFTRPGDVLEASNPLRMKTFGSQTRGFNRTAQFARATGEQLVLVESRSQPDYQLAALIQITPQR